jgi:D-alanine-D-alanine ligase
MKKLRILVLMHEDLVPPDSLDGYTDEQIAEWKTEYDVVTALRDIGHEVEPCGVISDLGVIQRAIRRFRPHIAFNLLEEFHGVAVFDQHVVSYLELMRAKYTGCNPRGLMLAHDKALSKKILAYHRVPVPNFAVFPIGRKVRRPRGVEFPLFVKSLIEEGSLGISHASIVWNDDTLTERVKFIHRTVATAAIAEQYIEGRELYVGIVGNERLITLPIWELFFTKLATGSPRIATAKVKWDYKYQKKIGLESGPAKDLSPEFAGKIIHLCKRAYRILGLSGYARMDLRLTDAGEVSLIEANPNPQLAYGEDFAESAHVGGFTYEQLLQRILNLGLRYKPH